MWARRDSFRLHAVLCGVLLSAVPISGPGSFAQEETGGGTVVEKRARERDLRDQLQNILRELEELQQQPAGGAVVTPVKPVQPATVDESSSAVAAEPIPQYELSDVSIVSNRVQRRPEGLSLSSTEQS